MRDVSVQNARTHTAKTVGLIVFVLAIAIAIVVLIPGCGSTPDYPSHLSFPVRKDRLVLKVPEIVPPKPNPGQLEIELSELDSRGGTTADPSTLSTDAQSALDQFLREAFGTPAAPSIQLGSDGEVSARVERLGLTSARLTEGGKLFRKHCLSCHGLPGDGRGQASLFLNPYPRDFRRGAFKFVTSGEGMKPRRTDLLRTIKEGLSPMPSFSLLQEQERELLALYVTFLAIRGQLEFQTLVSELSSAAKDHIESIAQSHLKQLLTDWEKAECTSPQLAAPDDGEPMSEKHQASVRRGYELFIAKTDTECLKCHGDFGRKPVTRYDIWGTVATPANFTDSKLRGGSRPEDVFARIRCGISAVGMPAHSKLSDRQVWDLVRFVQSASKPRELPEDVRSAVYPKQ